MQVSKPMVIRNLKRAWEDVTSDDIDMGERAYPVYHDTLRGLALAYQSPFVQTVEAFVAMSPNNDYHGNLRSLASLLHARLIGEPFSNCTITTYRACGERAWSYLTGEVSFSDTVKGKKITAFRHNILYPKASRAVTVDGHMIALGLGKNLTMSEANLMLRHRGLYSFVEGAVLGLSRSAGLPVPAVQASLWTMRKRRGGIRFSTQLSLFDEGTAWDRVLTPQDIHPFPPRK